MPWGPPCVCAWIVMAPRGYKRPLNQPESRICPFNTSHFICICISSYIISRAVWLTRRIHMQLSTTDKGAAGGTHRTHNAKQSNRTANSQPTRTTGTAGTMVATRRRSEFRGFIFALRVCHYDRKAYEVSSFDPFARGFHTLHTLHTFWSVHINPTNTASSLRGGLQSDPLHPGVRRPGTSARPMPPV